MSRKRFNEMNCSVARSLEIVGDWWTMLVIREAFLGTRRFEDFQRRLTIARNILSDRLRRLVEHGVFRLEPSAAGARRRAYVLTEKGRDLFPVLVALMQWGDRWVFGEGNEPIIVLEAGAGRPVRPVEVQSADGHALTARDTYVEAGPGASIATRERIADLTPVKPSVAA